MKEDKDGLVLLYSPKEVDSMGLECNFTDEDATKMAEGMVKKTRLAFGESNEVSERIENCRLSGSETLDLSNMYIKELPTEIESLKNLADLDVSYNKLESLPDWIEKLHSLKKLNLRENKLKIIPEWLGSLTSLEELDISWNKKIKALPNSFNQLCNLEVLFIQGTSLRRLPICIRNFKKLKKLSLGGAIRSFPEFLNKLQMFVKGAILKNALIFCNIYFSIPFIDSLKIPTWIGELSNLEYLYLGHWVSKIPKNIGKLRNLKQLIIHCRRIKTLPETIGNLSTLKEISIYGCNRLKMLPESICNLSSLKRLDITLCSNIRKLPESFGNLRSLNDLYINNSKITSLPESIGDLPALKRIEVVNCNIKTIPISIQRKIDSKELSFIKKG
jgi:Leucine-rich repeat (LRR) protein